MASKTIADYIKEGNEVRAREEAQRAEDRKPRGTVSIKDIESQMDSAGVSQAEKYGLTAGMITPNTRLLITE